MKIQTPEFSMVLMMGPSCSGKTTFAKRHFSQTEIISSDACRAIVSDDPHNQKVTTDAFQLLHNITNARLKNRRLTVVDATNLQPRHRASLVDIARDNDCPVTAIIMATPLQQCLQRNQEQKDQPLPEHVIRNQQRRLRHNARSVKKEGVRHSYTIRDQQEADEATVTRTKMHLDLRDNHGPFDIIGDIHGCHHELIQLLGELGYDTQAAVPSHPEGRQAIFLGDLVDRGPASDRVLEVVMDMTEAGSALCVSGNHDNKLMRSLKGNPVTVSHGLAETLSQLETRSPEFRQKIINFLYRLSEHYLLDDGNLAVAHAGVLEKYQARISRRVKEFCLYGQTTGETDEWGLPVRQDWALEYRGEAAVVYGHTPVDRPKWTNNTINVDTGCVFGGHLTALRYPERELVSVPAARTYYEPARPPDAALGEDRQHVQADPNPNALNLADISGHMSVHTASMGRINVAETQTAAALETISRHAVDPRWLIYLPPTISPSRTSDLPDILEHPDQALAQYRQDGVARVICEEKHMGSRGIIVLGRDQKSVRDRFGIDDPNAGTCYSRTGHRFFRDPVTETEFLQRTRDAITQAGLWETLETDWLVLDCEIMPWSLKAQGLLRNLYAPTGSAAVTTLGRAAALLAEASERGVDTGELWEHTGQRLLAATRYREAYQQYCWSTDQLQNVRVAPFHLMAAEGRLLTGMDHEWHMQQAALLQQQDPSLFQETKHISVDLSNPDDETAAAGWWEDLTQQGGEGMVVKPADFIPSGKRDHIQPAVKVRGPEYLRIIYGPEYDLPGNIERMKRRSLGKKRSLALREFALGLEGLQRFVDREPLSQVHQCAFAVMALETEPLDPRL